MSGVDIAFHPVVGCALAKFFQCFRLDGLALVEISAFPHDFIEAHDLRAVGVFVRLAACMMFAMHRGPLFGFHAGGDPQPEAEKMTDDRVQIESAVCGMTMQIDGDGGDGDVGEAQRNRHKAPKREIKYA